MKKTIFTGLMYLLCVVLGSAQVRIVNSANNNSLTNSPAFIDASSNVTVNNSTNVGKGLLFPRVDLSLYNFPSVSNGIPSSFPTRFDGMIVYNTATSGIAGVGATKGTLTEGFWYYENKSATLEGGIWKPLGGNADASTVKRITIPVQNGNFDTKNLIFSGKTSTANNDLKVVSIEPIFSDLTMMRNFLKVNSDVQVVNNAVNWTVNIENRNISSENQCSLQGVVISYLCDDAAELTDIAQVVTEIIGY